MTRNNEFRATETALQVICNNGMEGLAEAIRLLLNEAMKIERSQALNAEPYERTDERRGYANGYKPKTVATRLGAVKFDIPQVRGDQVEFYPTALETRIAKRTGAETGGRRNVCSGSFDPKGDCGNGAFVWA